MNEFFGNLGNWFIENKDAIILWLQGIGLGGIVGAIANIVVAVKRIKANTLSTNNLLEAMPIVGETKQSVDALVEHIDKLEAENKALQEENTVRFTEIQNSLDSILVKVNALVETESVKSQTIKDETIRTTVGNVLTNAKYNETQTRAKLLEMIAALKQKMQEKNAADTEEVTKALNVAQSLIEPTAEVVHTVVPRG